MAIEKEVLTLELEKLKSQLRTIETEQRKLETELKGVRQNELRTKREIEAISSLIDLAPD